MRTHHGHCVRDRERGSSSLVCSFSLAGLAVAIVGGLDQTIFAVLTQHVTPVTFFHYCASAQLGMAACGGGYTTALLGVVVQD